jgi:hypothetical protein
MPTEQGAHIIVRRIPLDHASQEGHSLIAQSIGDQSLVGAKCEPTIPK